MTTQRMIVILTFLSLSFCLHAQAQSQPVTQSVDKGGAQPVVSQLVSSPSQREIFTLKYIPTIFDGRPSRPTITGTFPNHQQARMQIDTGTEGIIFSEQLIRSLSLTSFPRKNPDELTMLIDGEPMKQVNFPDYKMTAASFSSPLTHAHKIDFFNVNGIANMMPQKHTSSFGADGILGTGLLNLVGATLFDGPKQEISFIIGGNLTAAERAQLGFTDAAASLVLTPTNSDGSGVFTVPVTFVNKMNFKQINLIVDTGSDITGISRTSALALQLQSTSSGFSVGVGGVQKSENAPVETIKIGNLVLNNTSVSFLSEDNNAPVAIRADGGATDNLGMNILAGYRMLLDIPAHMMYIMPEQPEVKIITK